MITRLVVTTDWLTQCVCVRACRLLIGHCYFRLSIIIDMQMRFTTTSLFPFVIIFTRNKTSSPSYSAYMTVTQNDQCLSEVSETNNQECKIYFICQFLISTHPFVLHADNRGNCTNICTCYMSNHKTQPPVTCLGFTPFIEICETQLN